MVHLPTLLAAVTLLVATTQADKPPIAYAHDDAVAFAATSTATAASSAPAAGVWTPPRPGVLTHWGRIEQQFAPHHQDNGTTTDPTPQLTASTDALEDGADLVVWWHGVKSPHSKDLLALSCGPRANPHDFLTTIGVDHTDATPNSVRFSSLYMMRCNYTVAYMHYDTSLSDYRELATITVGMRESFAAPKHGHIAFTSALNEMAVMYNSASNRTPVVQYGRRPETLTVYATGTSTTYKASDMCDAPATTTSQVWFRDPGFMHTVILTKLQLESRYYYRFGNPHDGWSEIYSFKSRPDPSVQQTKFLAYADMGTASAPAATSTAVRVFQDLSNGYDDFLLHAGDISYALGHGHVWDEFFHLIEPIATRVPYMVSIGNHEYDYMRGGEHDPSGAAGSDGRMNFHPSWANYGSDSAGECSVPMFHRWHTPANGHGLYWYSFDYGGVHVIQMSSEHDWRRGAPQYQWLEEDLKSVNRTKTPWVVLTSHRMMYTTQLGEDADLKVSIHFRDEMEDLLWNHKVNLMLVGHQHSYERSCAVKGGKCTPDGVGPVHIVVGSAGAGLETQGFSRDIGEWSVSHINDWGYLRVASTEDEMHVQFVLNRNGVVYDEVKLKPWV